MRRQAQALDVRLQRVRVETGVIGWKVFEDLPGGVVVQCGVARVQPSHLLQVSRAVFCQRNPVYLQVCIRRRQGQRAGQQVQQGGFTAAFVAADKRHAGQEVD